MGINISRFTIFVTCLAYSFFMINSTYFVVIYLLGILFASLFFLFSDIRIKYLILLFIIIISYFNFGLIFFTPLFIFEFLKDKNYYSLLPFLVLLYFIKDLSQLAFILIMSFISILIRKKDALLKEQEDKYINLINEIKENNLLLFNKNQVLVKEEKFNTNLAVLNERNRISKDMHDNLGHLLSRSILQIGALIYNTKDNDFKEQLLEIKDSLNKSMSEIRKSIHLIHSESIDLDIEIKNLIKHFDFCPIYFDYNIENHLPTDISYSLINIIKESLTNSSKHSNASQIKINFVEHPKFYTFLITDNGDSMKENLKKGIGLISIEERVLSFGGEINISTSNGFRIITTLKKEKIK